MCNVGGDVCALRAALRVYATIRCVCVCAGLRIVAALNLALSPFLLVFLVIYFFMKVMLSVDISWSRLSWGIAWHDMT